MADDLNGSLNETEAVSAKILSHWTGIESKTGNSASNVNSMNGGRGGNGGGGVGGGGGQIANYGAPSAGGNPYGGSNGFQYIPAQNNTAFSNDGKGKQTMSILRAAGAALVDVAALLPTSQETVNMGSVAERMRFYSNNMGQSGLNPQSASNNVPLYQYSIMNDAMRMGTAVGPDDITQAINMGAGAGLSTGLRNYNAGAGFSGILGGAALASNLAPGIGLTGGMGVMSNINQAHNVNMLKMLGINVRGENGTRMNDLPQIIEQLYGVLTKNNPNPTPEDIAVSLMPGNALDSLLNQYFGGDQSTQQVIISGLLQRIKSGNLRTSGTREALGLTGGTTTAIASLAMRNNAESQLIQGFTETTNKAMVGTNNLLQAMYRDMGGLALSNNAGGDIIRGIQQVSTALTTFGGIRGGAGATILSDLQDSALAGLTNRDPKTGLSSWKKGGLGSALGLGAGGLLGGYLAGTGDYSAGLGQDQANIVENLSQLPTAPGSSQSTVGNNFTGSITINVSVPPGADPYAYKAALADVFS